MPAYFERFYSAVDNLQVIFHKLKDISMSFSVIPVFLAFILNRSSVRFFTACRCVLGFTPFSSSLLFGLSLVAILVKHPELYPRWLRKINNKIIFLYEFLVSIIFIEIGFCMWNSIENFFFFMLPSFLENHNVGYYYILMVESPVGVSVISNLLALAILLLSLHITRVCNFNLLFRTNGFKRFIADARVTTKLCKHHRGLRGVYSHSSGFRSMSASSCMCSSKNMCSHSPKMLRSGKRFY